MLRPTRTCRSVNSRLTGTHAQTGMRLCNLTHQLQTPTESPSRLYGMCLTDGERQLHVCARAATQTWHAQLPVPLPQNPGALGASLPRPLARFGSVFTAWPTAVAKSSIVTKWLTVNATGKSLLRVIQYWFPPRSSAKTYPSVYYSGDARRGWSVGRMYTTDAEHRRSWYG